MSSRWVLVFAVAAGRAGAVAEALEAGGVLAVAVEETADDSAVVSVEVHDDPALVVEAAQIVRSIDPDAERLHDAMVQEPPSDHDPVPVFIDYDVEDVPRPCAYCAGWRHEVVPNASGVPVLREWHREKCPTYLDWL